jgi:hypothetical protein
MGELQLDELTTMPTTLVAEERTVKGRGRTAPSLEGRLSVGVPTVTSLVTVDLDDTQRRYIDAQPDHEFHLLHLGCTFLGGDGERIESAWFEVHMEQPGIAAEAGPIAWSMSPTRLVDKKTVERTVSFGAELKILDTLSIGPSVEQTTTTEPQHVWLRAFGELEPTIAWEFRSSNTIEIDGSHRLLAVVRSPAGRSSEARVNLVANVRRKLLGIFPFRADLDPATRTLTIG